MVIHMLYTLQRMYMYTYRSISFAVPLLGFIYCKAVTFQCNHQLLISEWNIYKYDPDIIWKINKWLNGNLYMLSTLNLSIYTQPHRSNFLL